MKNKNLAKCYVILFLLFTVSTTVNAAAEKPNIIFILADDLGYGDVHCLNPQRGKIKTPNLDRLAAQGMTFTDAHDVASVCTPSRYGLLTGLYAWRSRLSKGVLDGYEPPLIAPDRLTVAGLLQQHGYYTACIGKWHLGFTIEGASKFGVKPGAPNPPKEMGAPLEAVTTNGPTTRGFDLFYGFHHARMMKSVFENDRVAQIIEPVNMLPALVKRTGEFIASRTSTDKPFFLYFALNSPHTPIVPSAEWQGKSGLGDYGDFVMETDWAVGQVLEALDKAGVADNTLVIFSSDNGCSRAAGIKELEAKWHYPSGPFRGSKADIWDGGHRVPFFVRWPGKVKAGSQSSQLISLADFMATCAGILDVKLPDNAGEDSVSILPALLGEDKAPLHAAVVHHSVNGSFAIRQDRWKLVFCADSGGWSDPKPGSPETKTLPDTQLYDMSADIAESKNLQAEHSGEVARLRKLLEEIVANGRGTPGAKQANDAEIEIRKGKARKAAKK